MMNIQIRNYFALLVLSINLISSVHSQEFEYPTLITPKSCRSPLAIDWFINNAQIKPNFSKSVTDGLSAASSNLTAYLTSQLTGIDELSVVVNAPWGTISEFNYGKLRMNDTKDIRNVSGDSIYRVASVSKIFPVLELIFLQEQGKVSFQDSPTKYLPALKLPLEITLEMLASQLSGIDNDVAANPLSTFPGQGPQTGVVGYCGTFGVGCSERDLLNDISNETRTFLPQTQPAYSDDAFSILAQVVEKINGQNLTFAEIVQRDILKPLGMNRSAYVVPAALKSDVVIPNNTLSALSVDIDFAVFNGAGGLLTTTHDYTIFLHDIFLSKSSKLLPLVKAKKWLSSLYTNQDFVTEIGAPWEIHLQTLPSGRNVKVFGKSGGIFTFHSYVSINRDLGFSVVLFQTGSLDRSISMTAEANRLFAPVFEQANLDMFNAKYGGHYIMNDTTNTTIDIVVDSPSGSITLDKLQGRGVDVLGQLGLLGRGIQNRTNVLSYLWPGIDDKTFRFSLGDKTQPAGGAACVGSWLLFDQEYVKKTVLDMIQFVEKDGKMGILYPPLNLTAWKVKDAS